MSNNLLTIPLRVGGQLSPPAIDVDVRTWTAPHSLAPHLRDGLVAGTALCLIFAGRVFSTIADSSLDSADGIAGLIHGAHLEGLGAACFLLLGWVFVTRWRTGMVTIDFEKREVTWARARGWKGPPRLWTFEALIGAKTVKSWGSDAVRIDLGSRKFLVRLPLGTGQRFADSLNAIARARPAV